MDIADIAQEFEAATLRAALASRVAPAGQGMEPYWVNGRPHCIKCREPFSLRRYEAFADGTSLCAYCAELAQRV